MSPDHHDRPDHDAAKLAHIALQLGALGLLLYWSFVLVRPFVSIVIWSVVLTVALYPAYEWTADRLGKRRRLAAILITIATLAIVIGPVTWLALALIDTIRILAERLSTLTIPPPPEAVKTWPLIGDALYQSWDLASTNLGAVFAKFSPQLQVLGTSLLHIGADTGIAVITFLGSIVIAGFLFSSAPSLVDGVRRIARRLNATRGEEFVDQAAATIRAVSRGVIGVSVLQALLAAAGLIVSGVPHASLLAFTVLLLGIVQIGPSIVLIPVVIWAWTAMETGPAILFTAYMIPVNLLDNILRPIVMGRGLRTPMLVIVVGVIGGTLAYGITGLFLGPIVLAVIWELLAAWIGERESA